MTATTNLQTPLGRADLALMLPLLKGEPDARRLIAELLGFEPVSVDGEFRTDRQAAEVGQDRAPPVSNGPPADAPFGLWRVVAVEEVAQDRKEPDWLRKARPITRERLRSASRPAEFERSFPLLAPWSRIWPFIRAEVSARPEIGPVDCPRLVRDLSALRPIRRLPRRRRLRWAAVDLLRDCSAAMLPFQADMTVLEVGLARLCGKHRLTTWVFPAGPERPAFVRGKGGKSQPYVIRGGRPVLALTDFGANAGDPATGRAWIDLGQGIARSGGSATALAPCAPGRLPCGVFRTWRVSRWDLGQLLRVERCLPNDLCSGVTGPDVSLSRGMRSALRLASPLVRVDPELARQLRCLLPPRQTDGGLESALCLGHSPVRQYRRELCEEPLSLREALVRLIWWAHGDNPEILAEELTTIKAVDPEMEPLIRRLSGAGEGEGEPDRADHCNADIVQSLVGERWRRAGFSREEFLGYLSRRSVRLPDEAFSDERIAAAWGLMHRQDDGTLDPDVEIPAGMSLVGLDWVFKGGERIIYPLAQRGTGLYALGIGGDVRQYSPLGEIASTTGWVSLRLGLKDRPGRPVRWDLAGDAPVSLRPSAGERITIESLVASLTLERLQRPSWASEFGRGPRGLFAVLHDGRRVWWMRPGRYRAETVRGGVEDIELARGIWVSDRDFEAFNTAGHLPVTWKQHVGEDDFGAYEDVEISGVVQRFRWIPPGSFLMGSPAGEKPEPERYGDETPHEVELSRGFWLGDTACTQALWKAVSGKEPGRFKGGDRPVENVSWDDCRDFLARANASDVGLGLRLPTEAEWEYACRARKTTPFWFGETISPDQVNYDGNYPYAGGPKGLYREKTVPVGSLPPNDWGLYEMHGNVWEWCRDWYGPYPSGRVVDPAGPSEGSGRVLRGGSWFFLARHCRSASRYWSRPGARFDSFGLRLARGQGEPGGDAGGGARVRRSGERRTRRRMSG